MGLIEICGNYVVYEELYFERDLNNTFYEKMIPEGFRFGDPFLHNGRDIIRETEPGRESGIKARYARRLKKEGKNFNNWKDIVEKVEFLKDSNYSMFIKGNYSLKIKFEGEETNNIRDIVKKTCGEFKRGSKKRLHLESSIFGDEAILTFRSGLEMTDNIFLTYKFLHDYLISKDL